MNIKFKSLSFSIREENVDKFVEDLNKVIDKWTDNKETACYTWDLED